MMKVILYLFAMSFLQSCINNNDKFKLIEPTNNFCNRLDFYKSHANTESECQVLKLFDEICLLDSKMGDSLNVFRIRYFAKNDTGHLYTIYDQNNCSLLKYRNAHSSEFNIVVSEYIGDGHILTVRGHTNFISNNKFLENGNIDSLIEYSKRMKPYVDDGEIKDYVEIFTNGEYRRYECLKEQVDSIVLKIKNLK